MTVRSLPLLLLLLLGLASTASGQGSRQPKFPMVLDTGAGDLHYRCQVYMSVEAPNHPQLVMVADHGLNGDIFVTRADGSEGWQEHANQRGWNTYSLTLPGCGTALPPPTDDIAILTEKAVYGVYQMGIGTRADLMIAQGTSAAMAIKGRALDVRASRNAVLLDAWGPPGTTSRPQPTVDEVLETREDLDAMYFRRWGLGPKPGRFSKDSGLGPEGYAAMLERVDPDQPAYWAPLVSDLVAGVEVRDTTNLAGWRVLLVQGPHRTRDERRWDEELAAWLTDAGAQVERLALTDLDLPGISSLPMAGPHAGAVLDHFLDWAEQNPKAADTAGR